MTVLVLIGMVYVIIWKMFQERLSLNSVLLLLLINFMSGFKLKMMYISFIVSIRVSDQASLISIVFSCLCCCHGSRKWPFSFVLTKSSESKVKFKQKSNLHKIVLDATELAYTNKTKLETFGKLLIVFSIKVNLLYFLQRPRCVVFSIW